MSSATAGEHFFRRLLDLSVEDELEPLLDQAVQLIVDATGARVAYLELYDHDPCVEGGDASEAPRYWKGHACAELEVAAIRSAISTGILRAALAEGELITTASALADARFEDLGSVRQHQIQAVLAAPVGTPPVGVIYLQHGPIPGRFTEDDRARVERFARTLAPLADRIMQRDDPPRVDHARRVRERFRCPEIVGRSRAVATMLRAAALAPHHVLVVGPTGSGRTTLAKALAANGAQAFAGTVELSCRALGGELMVRTAASGAGTIVLDDVGALSAADQATLLGVLELRDHAGSASRSALAKTRLILVANPDLAERVRSNRFRADLYERLLQTVVTVPGLDERRDDIPELVVQLVRQACRRHELPRLPVSHRAQVACRGVAWPGHVRELADASRPA